MDDHPMSDSDEFNSTKALFHFHGYSAGGDSDKNMTDSKVSIPIQSPPKIGGNSGSI